MLSASHSHYIPDPLPLLEPYVDVLRDKCSLGIVYAGDPEESSNIAFRTENIRDWKSYKSVAEQIANALVASGFREVELLKEGADLRKSVSRRTHQLYFLNSAGVQGRCPMAHAASYLESMGMPYIGHQPLISALLDDKVIFKQWLKGIGLPTAPYAVRGGTSGYRFLPSDGDVVKAFGQHQGPFLVKPAVGRGSVDVYVTEDFNNTAETVEKLARKTGERVLIERFLPGYEFCVWAARGIKIENGLPVSWQRPFAFGQSERLYALKQRIFQKADQSNQIVDPARALSRDERPLFDDLAYLGEEIFTILALSVPIRLDVRRSEDGHFSILEANPKPDLSKPADNEFGLLSAALSSLDCSYEDFILKIVYDWLDFHLRYSLGSLKSLLPLFERYSAVQSSRSVGY